ncbi:MAG: helical membrane plugin domain-containing protein [Acidimicrobiales bacterium]
MTAVDSEVFGEEVSADRVLPRKEQAAPEASAGMAPVGERLEAMAEQLEEITRELRQQRQDRERWSELATDVVPLAQEAMTRASIHLEEDACDFSNVASLGHAFIRNAYALESWLGPLRVMAALVEELGPLGTPMVSSLSGHLQQLDERGYFSRAREAVGVLDTVVTSFGDNDVKQLGDNIVLILQTVKQMTQPEIMGMLGRAAATLQEGESTGDSKVPSARALLKQMRDPMVRRGMARLLATLRSVGDDATAGEMPGAGSSADGTQGNNNMVQSAVDAVTGPK